MKPSSIPSTPDMPSLLRIAATLSEEQSRSLRVALAFWEKVDKTDTCWLWTGFLGKGGYARHNINGAVGMVHRIAYRWLVGVIPRGMQLDHICHVRHCVKPEHLRPVTSKQNMENLSGLYSTNTSGYRGVSYVRATNKWVAQVMHQGVSYKAGYFDDIHEAGEAAKAKRLELYSHNELDKSDSP